MKLSKKLFAGSMVLALSLVSLHATEGQVPTNLEDTTTITAIKSPTSSGVYLFPISKVFLSDSFVQTDILSPKPEKEPAPYIYYIPISKQSLSNILDSKEKISEIASKSTLPKELVHRICNKYIENNMLNNPYNNATDTSQYRHTVLYRQCNWNFFNISLDISQCFQHLYNHIPLTAEDEITIRFLKSLLRVNKICDDSTLNSFSLSDLMRITENSLQGIHFNTTSNSSVDIHYNNQLFLIPFCRDNPQKIYIPEFKRILHHLLKTINVLFIQVGIDKFMCLKNFNFESGKAMFINIDTGAEVIGNINELAEILEKEKFKHLDIFFLDTISKNTHVTIKYPTGISQTYPAKIENELDVDYYYESSDEDESDSEQNNPAEKRARTEEETESEAKKN